MRDKEKVQRRCKSCRCKTKSFKNLEVLTNTIQKENWSVLENNAVLCPSCTCAAKKEKKNEQKL